MLRTNPDSPVTSTPATSQWPARCMLLVILLSAASHLQAQTADIGEASIRDLQLAMEKGELTAAVLVAESLARIEAFDDQGPAVNAIIHLNPEAREQAQALDEERRQTGPRGPLHGIPVILKDNSYILFTPWNPCGFTLANFS